MYPVSAQGVDERTINVHYYYFKTVIQAYEPELCSSTLKSAILCQPETCTHVCEPELCQPETCTHVCEPEPWTCP